MNISRIIQTIIGTVIFFLSVELVPFSGSPAVEPSALSETAEFFQRNGNGDSENLSIYPYERLKVGSSNPVAGINVTIREVPPELNQPSQSFFYDFTPSMLI